MNWKNILMAGVLGTLLAVDGWGCSAVDEYVEGRKAAREEKAEKARLAAEEAARQKAIQDKIDHRAAVEQAWSPTNPVSGEIEMPMAWFKEMDQKMYDTRKHLLDAQSLVAQMYGRYERKLKEGNEKQAGFVRLLELVEQAREKAEKTGYPVVAGHYVIKSEEDLDQKLADIHAEIKTVQDFNAEDEAMFNACIEARKHSRAIIRQFDIDYHEFTLVWDKVKLIKKGMIRGDLVEEIKNILDRTEVFVTQWNNPDTLRKL